MITIVDLNMGNVKSVLNMVRHVGFDARISNDTDEILAADRLILPGVGAFDEAMTRIEQGGLRQSLDTVALRDRKPVLGICLGMQLMTRSSEEGQLPGLAWVDAVTRKFQPGDFPIHLPIPHMGWNTAVATRDYSLLEGLAENRFYFVHSYHVDCRDEAIVLTRTRYGIEFHSAFAAGNIIGVQFHPEKSHRFGKQLLKNFCEGRHA